MRRIAFWALILNAIWELGQCLVLFDMWTWSFWRAFVWMWAAIAGDVVIVLGVAFVASLVAGAQHLRPPDVRGALALLAVGFVASVVLEWLARAAGLWGYSDTMPTLKILGQTIGLSPVVQVTVLPAVCVALGTCRLRSST